MCGVCDLTVDWLPVLCACGVRDGTVDWLPVLCVRGVCDGTVDWLPVLCVSCVCDGTVDWLPVLCVRCVCDGTVDWLPVLCVRCVCDGTDDWLPVLSVFVTAQLIGYLFSVCAVFVEQVQVLVAFLRQHLVVLQLSKMLLCVCFLQTLNQLCQDTDIMHLSREGPSMQISMGCYIYIYIDLRYISCTPVLTS